MVGAGAATNNSSAWVARVWQSEDGLPNNVVAGLVQTPDGYLWLGYPSGLARFDGVRFQEFSLSNFVWQWTGGPWFV
jgi:ligand-binding sensor domain-containing protein